MGLIDTLTRFVRGRKDQRITQAFTSFRRGLPYRPSHSELRSVQRWLNSWVYVCVERNATAVAQQPMRLFRKNNETPRTTKALSRSDRLFLKSEASNRLTEDTVEVDNHPFLDVIDSPNPILDRCGLLWLTSAYLQLTGNAYWYLSLDGNGQPVEIWPLPSQFVYPILGKDSIYDHYEFRIGGRVEKFKPEEIVHFRKPSPIDTIAGFGNLRGILEAAETNTKMLEYERALFENMGVPDILLSPKDKDSTTPEQLERFRTQFENEYAGWLKAGRTAIAPAEFNVDRLGLTNRELQFEKGKLWIREEIAAGFGVPMPILTVDGTTFNNLNIGIQLWMRSTIQPILSFIAERVNISIMPLYNRDREASARSSPWFVHFKNPVPEDADAQAIRLSQYVASGIMTINQALAELGEDSVAWGEEPWMAAGLQQPSRMADLASSEESARAGLLQVAELGRTSDMESRGQPTVGELASLLGPMIDRNDLDGVNMVRAALAQQLGATLKPLDGIAPSPASASGIVNPQDADDPPESSSQGNPDENGNGQGQTPPKKKPPNKPEGQEGGGDDSDEDKRARFDATAWQAKVLAAYVKLPRDEMGPDRKDDTFFEVLSRVFSRLGDEIKTNIQRVIDQFGDRHDPPEDKILEALFFREKWIEEFEGAALPYLEVAFAHGADLGAIEIGTAGIQAQRLSPQLIIDKSKELARKFSSSVVDLTGQQLMEAMIPGLEAGVGAHELSRRIADVIEQKRGPDTDRIARTELNNALNGGAADTWKANGIEEHQWLASADACEFCEALDGRRVKIGQPFVKLGSVLTGVKGGAFPANFKDVLYPTLHPHCVCTVVPIVE